MFQRRSTLRSSVRDTVRRVGSAFVRNVRTSNCGAAQFALLIVRILPPRLASYQVGCGRVACGGLVVVVRVVRNGERSSFRFFRRHFRCVFRRSTRLTPIRRSECAIRVAGRRVASAPLLSACFRVRVLPGGARRSRSDRRRFAATGQPGSARAAAAVVIGCRARRPPPGAHLLRWLRIACGICSAATQSSPERCVPFRPLRAAESSTL